MDVTPQLLTEVEFRQSLRGYDPDEVDRFLEQVAAAVAKLQGRLTEALHRADAAERTDGASRRFSAGSEVSTETITRTLVLAQRTADETVAEATAEAAEIRRVASADIEGLEAELASRRAAIHDVLEAEAREMAKGTTERLADEINQLELRRDSLHAAIAGLQPQLDVHRNRLAATTAALRELVDDAGAFVLDLNIPVADSAVVSVGDDAADAMAGRVIAATARIGDRDVAEDGFSTEATEAVAGLIDEGATDESEQDNADESVEHDGADPWTAPGATSDALDDEDGVVGDGVVEVDLFEDDVVEDGVVEDGVFDYDDEVIDLSTAELPEEQLSSGATVFDEASWDGPPTEAVVAVDADVVESDPDEQVDAGSSAYVDDLRRAVGGGGDSDAMSEFFADEGDGTVRRFGRTR